MTRLRGRASAFDALIPVVICTWTQADALVWSSPLNLVGSSAFLVHWWASKCLGADD